MKTQTLPIDRATPMHIISLGAGVQSSTMALMAARGVFRDLNGQVQRVDHAIFADTQSEPKSVMNWLEELIGYIAEEEYAFPVHVVTAGNLGADELRVRTSAKSGKRYLSGSIPAFVKKACGGKGLLGRKCTSDYKIIPIQRKIKELLGLKRANRRDDRRATVWIGISTDEAHRMKPSRVSYIENIWPLIDYGFSRKDCLAWMEENGFPIPPRSACVFCPFHSDSEWLRLKNEEPFEFARAVVFDNALRTAAASQEVLRGVPYIHSTCIPLERVDLEELNTKGHGQLSLFGNECEGMCGV